MNLRQITQLHEDPRVVAAWQRLLGPVLLWLAPHRRRAILAIGALAVAVLKPLDLMAENQNAGTPVDPISQALVVAALFALVYACYWAAKNFASLPAAIRKRPQLTLHALFWTVLAVLWTTSPGAGPWRPVLAGIAVVMPFLVWRLGYMLLSGQRGRAKDTSFAGQLMVIWPAFGGTNTPFGKGLDYMSRHEAKTDADLARSQLAGVKLLILSALWSGLVRLMDVFVYAAPASKAASAAYGLNLGIPQLGTLLMDGAAAPLAASWASVYCELVRQVLRHAVTGHTTIGILRLAGFNVFRNTYKPLLAESIVEFWNRYFYYFKELLSEFFFLPTFAKRFREHPRLRLAAAVFAAAFAGNMYYHIIQQADLVALGNVSALWTALNSRLFYCLLLAIGILVSMLRAQRRNAAAPAPGLPRRLLKMAGVWTFFALIFIWNARSKAGFELRSSFFLSLFGLA